MKKKLKTKTSTKVIMSIAEVVCKIWQFGRCKVRGVVNDFDYHITDLRQQYPNELVYKTQMEQLPFYCKTNEVDDEFERTSSIKIGDCNIRYTFDKLVRAVEVTDDIQLFSDYLPDPRSRMINDLLTQTVIKHNEPKLLKLINNERGESNVVKLHDK